MIAVLLAMAVQVGSKQFTESVILAEIAVQTLRAAGVDAEHRRELGGTRVLWEALRVRQIDVYPEYTGTISEELLRGEADLAAALERNGMRMAGPLGFEDTYAIGMRRPDAARLGIRSLSQLAKHPELEIGLTNEFLRRRQDCGRSTGSPMRTCAAWTTSWPTAPSVRATSPPPTCTPPIRRSKLLTWWCWRTIDARSPVTTPCCCTAQCCLNRLSAPSPASMARFRRRR